MRALQALATFGEDVHVAPTFVCHSYQEGGKPFVIGSHVFGARDVYISDHNSHPTSPKGRWEMTSCQPGSPLWKWDQARVDGAPVRIEDCVWLGRYCMVLKGVTIGRGSIVAAGAVVVKSIPPFSIAAGNPAKVVKTLENDLD